MNPILDRIDQTISRSKENAVPPINSLVRALHEEAIAELMKGHTQEALELFFSALEKSDSDPDLVAQSLINIGDWVRRITGNLQEALQIFQQAETFPMSPITKSRLYSMKAMIHAFPTEKGENDPEGIQRAVALLKYAIKIAQETGPEAFRAESLATHRLLGIACNWGTPEQKKEGLRIIGDFLPKLQDPNERARLNYSRAFILGDEHPREAAELLVQSAETLRQSSPLDTARYYARAGILFLKVGERVRSQECLDRAEELREFLLAHANSGPALRDIDALRKAFIS